MNCGPYAETVVARFLVLLLLLAAGVVPGQDVSSGSEAWSIEVEPFVNLRGFIREMGSRDPVPGVKVAAHLSRAMLGSMAVPLDEYLQHIGQFDGQYLEDGNLVTFTDAEGHFEFRSLPSGTAFLCLSNPGYDDAQEPVHLEDRKIVEMEFWLRRNEFQEHEMVVYGRAEEREISRQSLSVTEVESMAGFGGDVIKSLQALPGVARPTMDNPGAVVIRGSGNYDTRFFLDGIDIPLLFHYGGLKSTYNSLALESVDMYPGGFGTRYGNTIGGVVELKGRPGRFDRWHTVVDASLLDASVHVEGPLSDNLTVTLSGRRSFIGEVMDAALSGVDDLDLVVAPYYYDGIARVDYGQDTDHHVFFTFFGAKDRMSMIVSDAREGSPEVNEATNEIEMSVSFSRFILGYDSEFGDGLANTARAAYGYQREGGHVFGFFDFEGKGPLWQLRDEFSAKLNQRLTARVGGEVIHVPYDYRVKVLGWEESLEKKTFGLLGAWTNLDITPWPDLRLTPGVRHDS